MSQRPRDCGYRKSGVLSCPRNHVFARLEDGDDELVRGVQALAPHEVGGLDLRKKSWPSFLLFDTKKCPKRLEVSQFLVFFPEGQQGVQKTGQ